MTETLKTLLLPFDKGTLDEPSPDREFAFINARPLPGGIYRDCLTCEQSFRPDFLRLEQAGYGATPRFEDQPAEIRSGALMLIGRSRMRNEIDLRLAWSLVSDGGTIVIAGAKNDGIASLRKWASQHVEIAGSLSKHHGVVFWFSKNSETSPFPPVDADARNGVAEPGVFSADAPDPGSILLAEHFSADISGDVADFGAGWGYLSSALIGSSAKPATIACYEADWRALDACQTNVGAVAGDLPVSFHWTDLLNEPVTRRFDWVIMNPPFHVGRAADPKLGQTFIELAASSLKKGGRLLMVANQNLPYEKSLERYFASVTKLREEGGFKVFLARR